MSSNTINPSAYIRTTRQFPEELHQLTVEVDRTYVDIANAINVRTIGLFPTNRPAITGESWFTTSRRQESRRQIYLFSNSDFTGSVATITHGINLTGIVYFTRIWGTFNDGTYWQDLPYVDIVSVTNQINIKVSTTQIIITKGAGAPPIINNGMVIIEWMYQP